MRDQLPVPSTASRVGRGWTSSLGADTSPVARQRAVPHPSCRERDARHAFAQEFSTTYLTALGVPLPLPAVLPP